MGISALTRQLLLIDAATCLASGLLFSAGAGVLEPLLGLPAWLLLEAGIVLFPCTLFAAWAGRRVGVPAGPAKFMIALNVAWVGGSLALLGLGWTTPLGTGFVLIQALAVAALTAGQFLSLRHHSAMLAA